MAQGLGELLDRRRAEHFVGRRKELAQLVACLDPSGFIVTHVHGIGGIGKSSLLRRFSDEAAARGAFVINLDGRGLEPTERGFLDAVTESTGLEASLDSLEELGVALSELGDHVVILVDNYEHIFLNDSWIRQRFAPALRTNVHIVFASRLPPLPGWQLAPEWLDLFTSIQLDTLSEDEALDLLARAGLDRQQGVRINRVVRGHPLALRLAAAAMVVPQTTPLESRAVQSLIRGLADLHLDQIKDPTLRQALEASCVVRRITVPLLGALLPDADSGWLYEQLRELPFVEPALDGLIVHAAVQEAIASLMRASDRSATVAIARMPGASYGRNIAVRASARCGAIRLTCSSSSITR